jgi:hypothetical protein
MNIEKYLNDSEKLLEKIGQKKKSSWLTYSEKEKTEVFKFSELKGYDTQRLYAFLAERYLSFWFRKHTNFTTWPWKFYEGK